MKKHVSILALLFILGVQFKVYAESPCTTAFALGYSMAIRENITGLAGCEEALLEGPCKEEVARRYTYKVTRLYIDFSACCCANGYRECCN